jgi:AraC-like DNA-binding protein
MVYYASGFGAMFPLFKLAKESRYRIDMLCAELQVSPRHFRRLFTNALGICPKKWLNSERMVFARSMLRTGLPIKEVSDSLGFSAQKDFYREFRNCYGISPSEFRTQESERMMQRLGWAV